MQPNNMQQANACGTTAKCMGCMYKLICPRSPFCCLGNGGSTDLTPVLQAISNLSSSISDAFAGQGAAINGLDSKLNSIGAALNILNENVNSIGALLNTVNATVNEINSKITTSATTVETIQPEEAEAQGIVPFEGNDTVLVEKKGIFGKSKWVEEKRK